jgi:hypothetical protein
MENIMTQLDGYIHSKRYDGRIEDIRGAWFILKRHVRELEAEAVRPWWKKLFARR